MNTRSLLLIPAALAMALPSHANAFVGFRLNLAVPLYYPSAGYYYAAPAYPQTVVYQSPQTGVAGDQVTVAPGPGYVWLAGHWTNVSQRWVWVAGHWELPPSPSALWVAGHWVRGNSGWIWVDGAWTIGSPPAQPQSAPPEPPSAPPGVSAQQPAPGAPASAGVVPTPSTPPPPSPEMAEGTVVTYDPPAPLVETIPVCPYPDNVWVGGFWGWSGLGWYWTAGHYAPRPFHGAAWVSGGWIRAGRGWAWHGGRWR